MATDSTSRATTTSSAKTPAQLFATIGGAALVLAGLAGFLADASFGTGDGVDGGSLLGFEVNGWHNLVHLATGALLLSGAKRTDSAIAVCLAFAGGYALVTLYGLIDGNDVIRLVPVNAADNVLHIVLTLAAIAAALLSRRGTGKDVGV